MDQTSRILAEEKGKVALGYIFSIFMVILGAVDIHKCPEQPYIPIWMIVLGIWWTIWLPTEMLNLMKGYRPGVEPVPPSRVFRSIFVVLGVFGGVWTILGAVWIFGADVNYDSTSPQYCNRILYYASLFFFTVFCTAYAIYIISNTIYYCCKHRLRELDLIEDDGNSEQV